VTLSVGKAVPIELVNSTEVDTGTAVVDAALIDNLSESVKQN